MKNIGSLIMTGLSGTSLNKDEQQFITKCNIGGILLFKKNFESPAQLAELINNIQKCKRDYPLFIAVDQEGGRVQRFKDPFIDIPAMFEIAKLKSPKICFELLFYVAQELKAVGINLNFAPVCDVWFNEKNNVIGDRSFGENPEDVSKFVSSAIRGYQKAGLLTCAKHFPGHGRTLKDSHYFLPFLSTNKDVIVKEELPPFIKATKSKVDFVMMAHLQIDSIDSELPTSLSAKAHQFLRESLKFNKLIISDDMQMGAITKNYSIDEAAVMAIQAGADIIEYRDLEVAQVAYEALESSKLISQIDIMSKLERINQVKSIYFKNYKPIYLPEISTVFKNTEKLAFLSDLKFKLAK